MSFFTVIIVGGGITGLTLANILEQYGIDYLLIERHDDIAPQLGASIGLLPHGERILDQLGIFKQVESISMPVDGGQNFGPDGCSLKDPEPIGNMLEELLGYRMRFLDRQTLLKVLFENLQDKSKIRNSTKLVRIEELEEKIEVTLNDGSNIRARILVGADGVHSRTRQEIWRIAGSESPLYPLAEMRKSITSSYRCIFGISTRPRGTRDNMSYKAFHKNRSYLCVSGPEKKMYFFGFFKNPELFHGDAIPRYHAADAAELARQFGMDIVFDKTTFGDLFKTQSDSVLVPLEEYVLQSCYYKRVVLAGDSFHKMNPLNGQGGNSAIESAGLLADLLKQAIGQDSQLRAPTIELVFAKYQEERFSRTKILMENARRLQRLEALESWFLRFLQLNVTSKIGLRNMAPLVARASTPGRRLAYLPPNHRSGLVLHDEDVEVSPHDRSKIATALWGCMMLLIASLNFSVRSYLTLTYGGWRNGFQPSYVCVFEIAVIAIMVVESYRSSFLITPLFSAVPYLLASEAFGLEVVLPIYFTLHIVFSRSRSFYYPAPRAIPVPVAKALQSAFGSVYILLLIELLIKFNLGQRSTLSISAFDAWLPKVGIPFSVHIFQGLHRESSKDLTVGQVLFGHKDLKHLLTVFNGISGFSAVAHLCLVSKSYASLRDQGISKWSSFENSGLYSLSGFCLCIVCWCLFIIWDLRRVTLTDVSLPKAFLGLVLGSIVIGPGSVLASFWRWREICLETGRRKKKSVDL